jgi:hypothetical protein
MRYNEKKEKKDELMDILQDRYIKKEEFEFQEKNSV